MRLSKPITDTETDADSKRFSDPFKPWRSECSLKVYRSAYIFLTLMLNILSCAFLLTAVGRVDAGRCCGCFHVTTRRTSLITRRWFIRPVTARNTVPGQLVVSRVTHCLLKVMGTMNGVLTRRNVQTTNMFPHRM